MTKSTKALVVILIAAALFAALEIYKKTAQPLAYKYHFADATWPLIRESVAECGSDQSCHYMFQQKHVDKLSLDDETREKVKRAMEYVTSGAADKKEPDFVETNLGNKLHARLHEDLKDH